MHTGKPGFLEPVRRALAKCGLLEMASGKVEFNQCLLLHSESASLVEEGEKTPRQSMLIFLFLSIRSVL